ncbi:esterase-like activity of phytase family protein [Desulfogranum marinum]|uniref:esterase-like activity of phytase family protein n=1 Tax=Desulfogranum marinum TaxID=453220 RepID=UPI0019658DE0|nr:esterase-like activity of phytase family protein [Desulfogranum marinum]MBM9511251.1 esterase-like activity of phytase family protein [Desulfogranum marinum]
MKSLLLVPLLLMQLSVLQACAVTLELIGDQNFRYDTQVGGTVFNGLSGLAYDLEESCFYAVSDDRSQFHSARYYVLAVDDDDGFTLTPQKVIFFQDADRQFFKKNKIDFEGLAILGNKNLLVSSEGPVEQGEEPSLTEFRMDGSFVKQWNLPSQFIQGLEGEKGVRENLGLEALTVTPNFECIFTANEQALKQDGKKTTIVNGSPVRIIKYSKSGKVLAHYPYMVSPVPNPTGMNALQGGNGLVELLALDEYRLLAMERSWVTTLNKVYIRIYLIDLEEGRDVSSVQSLKSLNRESGFVKKTLVLDLDSLLPLPDPEYSSLDNIEGMSFGPDLPDGSKTLFLVSDGNFNTSQRTLFLAFKIRL